MCPSRGWLKTKGGKVRMGEETSDPNSKGGGVDGEPGAEATEGGGDVEGPDNGVEGRVQDLHVAGLISFWLICRFGHIRLEGDVVKAMGFNGGRKRKGVGEYIMVQRLVGEGIEREDAGYRVGKMLKPMARFPARCHPSPSTLSFRSFTGTNSFFKSAIPMHAQILPNQT